jgi:ribosome biogenesis protein SSF1/2
MPRRGRRRRKHRTHVDEEHTAPVVLVARRGSVGSLLKRLVQELRIVLYPNSPLHFRETSHAPLKDLLSLSKTSQVDNLLFLTSTTASSYMKAIKLPKGPTLTFKIDQFSLSHDVRTALKKHVRLQPDFKAPPLLVMRGVSELPALLFKSMFSSMELDSIKLKRCRRVVLIDCKDDVYRFRHYIIKSRPGGISPALKKLSRNQIPNLNRFNSVNEWMEDQGNASESEYEDAEVPNESSSVSLRLVELGPRINMKLHKIEEGICAGNVMFHAVIKKSKKKAKEDGMRIKERQRIKEERRRVQDENVKKKLLKRRQKLGIMGRKRRKIKEEE